MRRSIKLVLGSMLVSLTLSVGHPACAQTESIDPELLKPHLVAVERGRRLQIACAGDGSPTIVFEQGAEGSIVDWRKVQAKASAISRTCFYDRAGFGLSDPPSDGVDGIHVTDDLRRLLLAADIRGPVVLVGNSIGGFYATLFADRFPQQVAGIVLVNSNFAGQFAPGNARQRKRELQNLAKAGQRLKTCAELAKQGALSAQTPQGCFSVAPDLTAAEANYLLRGRTRPSWYEAEIEQSNSFFPSGPEADSLSWRQERLAHREFGDLPVVVLSSESPPGEPIQNVKSPAEESQRWKDGQRKLAARSTRGEWREVPGSTQLMLSDQPQRIIEAIQKVVAEARASIAVTNKAGKPIKAAKGGRAAKRTR